MFAPQLLTRSLAHLPTHIGQQSELVSLASMNYAGDREMPVYGLCEPVLYGRVDPGCGNEIDL
jgi:hypothetical protein